MQPPLSRRAARAGEACPRLPRRARRGPPTRPSVTTAPLRVPLSCARACPALPALRSLASPLCRPLLARSPSTLCVPRWPVLRPPAPLSGLPACGVAGRPAPPHDRRDAACCLATGGA
eukprot:6177991-Pleurochrysis_carterae.AAC.1